MPNRVTSQFIPEVKKQNNNMSSMKRASKNKASPQDNNTVVQTWNKTNYSKAKRTSSTKNAVQNVVEPLGKIANNRHGKKDKASYDRNKDLSNNDSDNENKDDIQQNDDKANNTDDEDDNDDDNNNNNDDEDDVSQSGFSNGSTENQQNEETYNKKTNINVVTLDYLQKKIVWRWVSSLQKKRYCSNACTTN